MKKQTAVEWLGLNLNALFLDISSELWLEVELIFQKAKAMEKEQIIEAFQKGDFFSDYYDMTKDASENYYNKTYKGGDK
jgi:hypothetical protein